MRSTNPNQSWYDELHEKYPKVLPEYPRSGIWVLEGWKPMIERLLGQINEYVTKNEINDFRIDQIKEKFWELRVYHSHPLNHEIQKMIDDASGIIGHICTECGAPANRYQDSDGRYHRLCNDHINELGNK